ncbi:uncharacterized protein LOC125680372 [Ostrea edulis]|uniref:uncharacterized protein LOC125680372 n=1 Tax=Ostrea edulis TaxID=37623 RepID=UPI0020947FB0|nr:uncharacterized protein LOC125680372 [Ostrea edulis]
MAVGGSNSGSGSRNSIKIFANIFISFIGAGVLGLPFAFKEAGILEGIVVMTLVGITSVKAMLLIVDCKYQLIRNNRVETKIYMKDNTEAREDGLKVKVKDTEEVMTLLAEDEPEAEKGHKSSRLPVDFSYGDIGQHALGHIGRVFVDVAILISQAGFCCAYLIFISENLSSYIPKLKLIHWLILLLPPLCLLTLLRQLKSLALTSLLAQCSNLLAFGVVFWFDFEHFHHIEIHPKNMSIKGLPFFLAISIYCYEGAGMILSLEGSLAADIRYKFKRYFVCTMVIVTSLYISFGSAGYLSFGPETNPIITLNLPKGESQVDFAMVVKTFLCLALFFTYPVMMFPVMKLLENYFITDAHKKILKGNILRVFTVFMTGCIVLVIPNFANLMALVGATCCTMLAFTLPGLFHMCIFKGNLTIYQVIIDWTLIFLGVVGAVIGTIDALQRLHASQDTGNEAHDMMLSIQNITTTLSSAINSSVALTAPK